MNCIFDYDKSRFALEIVGDYLYFNKDSDEDAVNYVFFRVKENGKKFLRATYEQDMSFWQKAKRFFGHKDYSLDVVSHLANKTLKQLKKNNESCSTGIGIEIIKSIEKSVELINNRIVVHNDDSNKSFFENIFGNKKIISEVNPLITSGLIKLLPKESKSDSLNGRVKYTPPKQDSSITAPPPPPVITSIKKPEVVDEGRKVISKPPRGIKNPSCLCYCNSTIQLIAQDTELRATIWKDEGDETGKAIKDLQDILQDIKKKDPVFDVEKGDRIFRFCPTLRNAFINTKNVRILLENIPKEIKNLENQKKVRESFLRVLEELDKGEEEKESLSHYKGSLRSFNEAMQGLFPLLKNIYEQQDQHQFFLPLLEALHSPEEREKGFAFVVQNERSVFEKTGTPTGEIEEKGSSLHKINNSDYIKKFLNEVKDPLEKIQCIYALITIPTVRPNEPPESEPFVTIHPEADEVYRQSVKNHFYDLNEENVELDAILGNENNKHILEEVPELKGFLESMIDKDDKRLPSVWRSKTRFIKGEPKKYLPVYIARFTNLHKKNQNKVVCDPVLNLLIEGKDTYASYEIKSITCHSGSSSLQGGHYFHYRPENDSPVDEKGMPSKWVCISDRFITPVLWKDIAEQVYSEAVFYDYNLI